jgi:hypothetical protein
MGPEFTRAVASPACLASRRMEYGLPEREVGGSAPSIPWEVPDHLAPESVGGGTSAGCGAHEVLLVPHLDPDVLQPVPVQMTIGSNAEDPGGSPRRDSGSVGVNEDRAPQGRGGGYLLGSGGKDREGGRAKCQADGDQARCAHRDVSGRSPSLLTHPLPAKFRRTRKDPRRALL